MSHDDMPGGEVFDLLARLVALPTDSRSPNVELIELCAERWRAVGGDVSVLPGGQGRANLLARIGPPGPGGLLLSGHTDVVPAGTGWATNPYQLTAIDDRLHGRGTADMKAFVAVAIVVAERAASANLDAPLYLALSYDEEIGCIGVRGLLEHLVGRDDIAPDLVVIGEPTSMRVCVAHTGKVSYTARFQGRAGHSSEARTHPSAVVAAAELAVTIDGVQRIREADGVPGDDGFHHVSTNVGTIGGGVAINVMAAEADLAFEIRHSADVDVTDLLAPVWADVDRLNARLAVVGGGVKVEQLASYPALHTPETSAAVSRLHRVARTGPVGTIGFGCEGGLYAERLGAPVVICGPGDIGDAHRPDEFVALDQLATCQRVIERAVAEFCDNERSSL